jgi:dephospho-CoA kinase
MAWDLSAVALRVLTVAAAWVPGFSWYALRHGRRAVPLAAGALAAALLAQQRDYRLAIVALLAYLHGRRVRCIGLTGGIATGKSAVSRMLAAKGAVIVDADIIARAVVEPGAPAYQRLVAHFGDRILEPAAASAPASSAARPINRAELRRIIMHDAAARRVVNQATHPAILRKLLLQVLEHRWLRGKTVVVDAPLLFESGLGLRLLCSPVIVVSADGATQLARLQQRDALDHAQAAANIAAQMPLAKKEALADVVVHNNGSLEDLQRRVDDLWRRHLGL